MLLQKQFIDGVLEILESYHNLTSWIIEKQAVKSEYLPDFTSKYIEINNIFNKINFEVSENQMTCDECSSKLVLCAFSTEKCKVCEYDVVTPHIPSHVICEQHSKEYNLCQQCGKKLGGEESHLEF